jgi:hypothetical protein
MKTSGQSKEKQETVSQAQQEQQASAQLTQPTAEGEQGATASAQAAPRKKRAKRLVSEAELMPRPSFWPIALAASLALALFGFAWNAIFLGIGAVLVVVCISGWALERR